MTKFYKYQGAGNDFIMIDDRDLSFASDDVTYINNLCDRRFGIGADGLILLQNDDNYDFRMVYFNSDGKEGSMCGNGGRCCVAFAKQLGVIENSTSFIAVDGEHEATIEDGLVNLKMGNVENVEEFEKHYFLNTGSPHHVEFVNELSNFDVYNTGKEIRNGAPYFEEGTNVNFAEKLSENHLRVRTFERGVENETLACGTGVTAVAIAAYKKGIVDKHVKIDAEGGKLEVSFKETDKGFEDIYLKGPAEFVFEGTI